MYPIAMTDLLREVMGRGASDLYITVGVPPVAKIHGALTHLDYPVLTAADTDDLLRAVAPPEQQARFRQTGEADFAYALPGVCRFRVNAFRQRGASAIVLRGIPEQIPTLEQLGLPEALKALARKPRGLVLVTGPTGNGKSTTLAAMIDLINTERALHVITLEDPIEYVHMHKKSVINQREIHNDTASFASGLRAALREDPDVILVGEMRDPETIAIAITAAETGHLVFATLHTSDAAQTVDRIIDVFPPHQQPQIRVQLAMTLQGVVSQQLLPRRDGTGRVAAVEVLVATPAVRNLIREGKTHQIISAIQTGGKFGMQTMDAALCDLCRRGAISIEEAASRASDADSFMRMMHS